MWVGGGSHIAPARGLCEVEAIQPAILQRVEASGVFCLFAAAPFYTDVFLFSRLGLFSTAHTHPSSLIFLSLSFLFLCLSLCLSVFAGSSWLEGRRRSTGSARSSRKYTRCHGFALNSCEMIACPLPFGARRGPIWDGSQQQCRGLMGPLTSCLAGEGRTEQGPTEAQSTLGPRPFPSWRGEVLLTVPTITNPHLYHRPPPEVQFIPPWREHLPRTSAASPLSVPEAFPILVDSGSLSFTS